MDYRPLGSSGLQISALTLGTMTFGGEGNFAKVGDTDVDGRAAPDRHVPGRRDQPHRHRRRLLRPGARRRSSARRIAGRKRDDVLLATKVRMPMGGGPNDAGLSRHHVISGCEASLRRLRTDHIDLYQVHEWDGLTPLEETLEALRYLSTRARSATSASPTTPAGS